jgi:hypothetical protein
MIVLAPASSESCNTNLAAVENLYLFEREGINKCSGDPGTYPYRERQNYNNLYPDITWL